MAYSINIGSAWQKDSGAISCEMRDGALRESPKARSAVAVLEQHGWLVALPPGTVLRGTARKEAWRIVRDGDVV